MEPSKRNTIIVCSCAAAVTGIAAVAAILKWQHRRLVDSTVTSRLRNVHDVLADCYRKINEIEEHIPDLSQVAGNSRSRSRSGPTPHPA